MSSRPQPYAPTMPFICAISSWNGIAVPSSDDGLALLERDDDLARLGRGGHRHRPHAGRRRGPRILHLAALDRSTPEVVVDRVQLLLRRRDRDVVPVRVEDRVLAGEAPVTHRREHLEIGSERPHADLEAHLVVALARATVGDRVGTPSPGREHEVLRDDRPSTSAETSGYLPSYFAFAFNAGVRISSANSSRRSRTSMSVAPAAKARSRTASQSPVVA